MYTFFTDGFHRYFHHRLHCSGDYFVTSPPHYSGDFDVTFPNAVQWGQLRNIPHCDTIALPWGLLRNIPHCSAVGIKVEQHYSPLHCSGDICNRSCGEVP